MKRTIVPNIVDRNAALPSAEGADSLPNGQGSSPPALANTGSPAPMMVGGSPEGRPTPLPIDGLANDSMQVPSSVAGAAGSGVFTIVPVSDPQLMVRTSGESEGSATASATSPSAQATSPMLPTASLSTVAPQSEIEEQYQLGRQALGAKDYKQALMWFQKAAEQGHSIAQFNLGVMYDQREGVKEDLEQALIWYREAAMRGDADAQYYLAEMYYKGKGVKEDFEQAAKWYLKAANQDDKFVQYRLGLMYLKGWCVEKNVSLAAYWTLQSSMDGEDIIINIGPTEFPEFTEFTELFQYIPDILRNNPEFKNVTNLRIYGFELSPPYISLVDRLIRFNSNIQLIDIEIHELRHDVSQKSAFDDFVRQMIGTIQAFNTSLTKLDFWYENVDSVERVRLNQVLAQNQSIATLRKDLQKHSAAHSDELPQEVLMLLADELIVQGCKSGQSEQAVKAALNELLMSVQAGRLNVPIRQAVQ